MGTNYTQYFKIKDEYKMKILTTGCSFTHMDRSWANYLSKKYDLTNVAQGGAGNEFNFRNAGLELLQNDYDIAIFQLSGINRFELILAEDNFEVLSDITDKSNHAHLSAKENYCWIKSTGDYEWWNVNLWNSTPKNVFDIKERKIKNFCGKFVKNYRMYADNYPIRLIDSLTAIVNVQNICKLRNVKPLFFSWMKELHQEKYQMEIKKNPSEIGAWYDQIDWSNWWFHNDNEGLAEWGIDNGYAGVLDEDHINNPPTGWSIIDGKKTMIGHPSTECHKAFAEKVIKPWIRKND